VQDNEEFGHCVADWPGLQRLENFEGIEVQQRDLYQREEVDQAFPDLNTAPGQASDLQK